MKQAERRKFHYIYKITRNDGSGKYYIGMHSTDDLEDGYFGSGQLLWKSIKKYGKEIHSKEILEFLPTRQELKTRERELVNEEIVNDPLCMNLKLGGEGGWDRANAIKTAQQRSTLGKLARSKSPGAAGMKVTAETKLRISQALSGRANWSPGTTGKSFTKSVKPFGTLNSQYGTCWVTSDYETIKIKKERLDEYLANGYRRGRK